MFGNFFNGKRVLVTGHTGFKGSWLSSWLKKLGAQTHGIALDPKYENSVFDGLSDSGFETDTRCDVRDRDIIFDLIGDIRPDIIFHLAAQPLVKKSYEDPLETWTTNLFGTLNILEGIRHHAKPCTAVMITSDKCYENSEWVFGYRETDQLGGIDPYSASKAAAEIAISSYARSFNDQLQDCGISISSARAGNVIGGGDWSKDRIIPDLMRAWLNNKDLIIRKPLSTRPWQHVLEPLSGYLTLARAASLKPDAFNNESFNFGPIGARSFSVKEVVEKISDRIDLNYKIQTDYDDAHEAGLLKLNCDKAVEMLNWYPKMTIDDTLDFTIGWYQETNKSDKSNIRSSIQHITDEQIKAYEKIT